MSYIIYPRKKLFRSHKRQYAQNVHTSSVSIHIPKLVNLEGRSISNMGRSSVGEMFDSIMGLK